MGKARGTAGKRHENQKDMIRVVGPGYDKMMELEKFREWEKSGGEGIPK